MRIWVNCLVKNEDQFVWFSIMSVIDYVDKVLVWDTGSSDETVKVIHKIQKIKGKKIEFKKKGAVDKNGFTKLRQEQLDRSTCDWIIILDGDEIWWEESIKRVIDTIKQDRTGIEGIVVPFYNSVGDVYHYQEPQASKYRVQGHSGHLTIRAINKKIPGLHVDLPYGQEGYFDKYNRPIQDGVKLKFLNTPYLHATFLKRSSIESLNKKYKVELGKTFDKDFSFPEVFNREYPSEITNPWKKRSIYYLLKAFFISPIISVKRSIESRINE